MLRKQSLLVTGCNGFLGSSIINKLKQKFNITGIDKQFANKSHDIKYYEIDITNKIKIEAFLNKNKFDIILHCAAIINVDYCEENYQQAININAIGTKNLVKDFDGLFVYISTDMLFDGMSCNYSEEDVPNPINNYGRTKLEGEKFVQQYSENYLILRTNFFGWNYYSEKETFVEWIFNSLSNGREISLFYDYIFCPIYINDFINIMRTLIKINVSGIFNVFGKNCISKFEFGNKFADKFNLNKDLIKKISIKDHSFIANRPQNMSHSINKLLKQGIMVPSLSEGLNSLYADRIL
ncbi:SDR family oxidoreductase [Bacteroidota bacterium]